MIVATYQPEANRIALRFPYNKKTVAEVRQLPNARFSKSTKTWTCLATPAACHRLINAFGDRVLEINIRSLAEQWQRMTGMNSNNSTQPNRVALPLWKHQCNAYWFANARHATMLAMGMGTGKSAVAISLADNSDAQNVLIACPKAVIPVWCTQFQKFSDRFHTCPLIDGTTKSKTQFASNTMLRVNSPKVFVVNYETIFRKPLNQWIMDQSWDWMICDESHKIKAPQGRASKFCFDAGQRSQRRLCLTGTPLPHSPLDAFAQYRFLDAGLFGTSFTRFRSHYALCSQRFPGQVLQWLNQEELSARMDLLTFRAETEDVLNLPEKIETEIPVALDVKTMKLYRELENEMIAEIEHGEITAANALVKLLRLQQITSGAVTTDDGTTHTVDQSKEDVLCELIEDIGRDEKIVVFARFRYDLETCRRVANKMGRSYGELSGLHNDMQGEFLPEHIDGDTGFIFGVQISSGGAGVDLTRSAHAIYYSVGFSLGDYLQSMARLHRPGQHRSVRYYQLVAAQTVDEHVYRALSERSEVVNYVMERIQLH